MQWAWTALAIAQTLACASGCYSINYDTRGLEKRVQALERAVKKATNRIAVLKAERAYLARPARIEPLARALGMQPLTERQYVGLGGLNLRHDRPNGGLHPPHPAQGDGPARAVEESRGH
jgi:cell division protein FtsL